MRLAIAALVLPFALGAQAPLLDSPVRIWTTDGSLQKRRMELTHHFGDTLVLNAAGSALRLPVSSIARIERLVPRTPDAGATHGAKVGALLGAAAGLTTGLVILATENCPEGCFVGAYALLIAPPTLAVGGALGGFVLGMIAPGRNWRCVPGMPCRRT